MNGFRGLSVSWLASSASEWCSARRMPLSMSSASTAAAWSSPRASMLRLPLAISRQVGGAAHTPKPYAEIGPIKIRNEWTTFLKGKGFGRTV